MHYNSNGAMDLKASVLAAQQLFNALGIDPRNTIPPALDSNHTRGLAIDMKTTWSVPTITIVDGNGHSVTISTGPHDGLNKQLIAVGATYHVIHFIKAKKDPNHWSVDGH